MERSSEDTAMYIPTLDIKREMLENGINPFEQTWPQNTQIRSTDNNIIEIKEEPTENGGNVRTFSLNKENPKGRRYELGSIPLKKKHSPIVHRYNGHIGKKVKRRVTSSIQVLDNLQQLISPERPILTISDNNTANTEEFIVTRVPLSSERSLSLDDFLEEGGIFEQAYKTTSANPPSNVQLKQYTAYQNHFNAAGFSTEAYCTICLQLYKSRYSLWRHFKTKKHQTKMDQLQSNH